MSSLYNRCYYVVCGMSFMLFNEYENLPGSWREMRRNLLHIIGLCVERQSCMQACVREWVSGTRQWTRILYLIGEITRIRNSRNAHTNRISQPLSVHMYYVLHNVYIYSRVDPILYPISAIDFREEVPRKRKRKVNLIKALLIPCIRSNRIATYTKMR